MKRHECLRLLDIPSETRLTLDILNTAFFSQILKQHPDNNLTSDAVEKTRDLIIAHELLTIFITTGCFGPDEAKKEPLQNPAGGEADKTRRELEIKFPREIHIIEGTPLDKFFSTASFMLILANPSFQINMFITLGESASEKIKPRSIIESLIVGYLSYNSKKNTETLIPQPERKVTEAASLPKNRNFVIIAGNSYTYTQHPLSRPPELDALSDEQVDQLMNKLGLEWIIQETSIRASMEPIPLTELNSIKSDTGKLAFLNVAKAITEAKAARRRRDETFATVLQYLFDENNWRIKTPEGINQMKTASQRLVNSEDFFHAIKEIAQKRLDQHASDQATKTASGFLKSLTQNGKATQFYQQVVDSESLDALAQKIPPISKNTEPTGGGGGKKDTNAASSPGQSSRGLT
jgi:hypothetical protein